MRICISVFSGYIQYQEILYRIYNLHKYWPKYILINRHINIFFAQISTNIVVNTFLVIFTCIYIYVRATLLIYFAILVFKIFLNYLYFLSNLRPSMTKSLKAYFTSAFLISEFISFPLSQPKSFMRNMYLFLLLEVRYKFDQRECFCTDKKDRQLLRY